MPSDGNYSVLATAIARDGGSFVSRQSLTCDFVGVTIDYSPEKIREELQCLLRYKRIWDKARPVVPKPGDLVVSAQPIWDGLPSLREIDKDLADAGLAILKGVGGLDVKTSLALGTRLEELVPLPRWSQVLSVAGPNEPSPLPAASRGSTLQRLRAMQARELGQEGAGEAGCGCWFR